MVKRNVFGMRYGSRLIISMALLLAIVSACGSKSPKTKTSKIPIVKQDANTKTVAAQKLVRTKAETEAYEARVRVEEALDTAREFEEKSHSTVLKREEYKTNEEFAEAVRKTFKEAGEAWVAVEEAKQEATAADKKAGIDTSK